jgi:hypothetical protein
MYYRVMKKIYDIRILIPDISTALAHILALPSAAAAAAAAAMHEQAERVKFLRFFSTTAVVAAALSRREIERESWIR